MLSVKSWKSFCESEKKLPECTIFPDHSEAICVFFALLSPGDSISFFKLRKLVHICSNVVAWTSVSYVFDFGFQITLPSVPS